MEIPEEPEPGLLHGGCLGRADCETAQGPLGRALTPLLCQGGAATCRSPSKQPRLLALVSGFHETVCLAGLGATPRVLQS